MKRFNIEVDPQKNYDSLLGDDYFIDQGHPEIIERMPGAQRENVEIVFFKISKDRVTYEDYLQALEEYGLVACDPITLFQFNNLHPYFHLEHYNTTAWIDEAIPRPMKNCHMIFRVYQGASVVVVGEALTPWGGDKFWFAGIPK